MGRYFPSTREWRWSGASYKVKYHDNQWLVRTRSLMFAGVAEPQITGNIYIVLAIDECSVLASQVAHIQLLRTGIYRFLPGYIRRRCGVPHFGSNLLGDQEAGAERSYHGCFTCSTVLIYVLEQRSSQAGVNGVIAASSSAGASGC
jgi:hypothetical protein